MARNEDFDNLTVAGIDVSTTADLDTHTADTTNPHAVTASQADALPISGGTLTGNLQVGGQDSIVYNEGNTGNNTRFINLGTGNHVIEFMSNDRVNIPNGRLGMQGNFIGGVSLVDLDPQDGSGDKWHLDPRDSDGFFVVEYHASDGSSHDAIECAKDGSVNISAGDLSVNGGTTQQQRGAPTTTELADGYRMTYVSDGTDAYAAGDLVSARNAAGTIVSQTIVTAANDS